MSDDLEVLAEFVIWRLRSAELPVEVAAAAERLCPQFPRPDIMGGYLDADFSVSGIPEKEADPSPWVRCFGRRDAIDQADKLVNDGFDYVLVQRLSRA